MADIKTGYTWRELIFADFTGCDLKKLKIGLKKYSKWPDLLKLILVKFLIFFAEKKNAEIFIFFCLKSTSYLNILKNRIFSKVYC